MYNNLTQMRKKALKSEKKYPKYLNIGGIGL